MEIKNHSVLPTKVVQTWTELNLLTQIRLPLKDILQIKEISYGVFPEICGLNPRFNPNSKKVKVVLDVRLPKAAGNGNLPLIFKQLTRLLPSLEKHQCGEHLLDELKSGKSTPHLHDSGSATDIAHLMEHVMIDLQSRLTGMNSCSGITCAYRSPQSRFDMFVECRDQKVGLFTAFFAAELLSRLVKSKSLSRRYSALIDLAKYLYAKESCPPRNGRQQMGMELDPLATQISSTFNWKKSFVLPLLRTLKDFGFLNGRLPVTSR